MILPLKYIVDLFFPTVCIGCGQQMQSHRQHLCTLCLMELPFTGFENSADNPVAQIFYGRVKIEHATALVFFSKNEIIQQCLHEIKYQNNVFLAHQLGEVFGKSLVASPFFSKLDMIIPVALHKTKLKKRGYNQSERIAQPIASALKIPMYSNVLFRTHNTESQTKKHRMERWQNMEGKFEVKDKAMIAGKHILLIDDVVTTGATLEASAQVLIDSGAKVSIAVLAFARD